MPPLGIFLWFLCGWFAFVNLRGIERETKWDASQYCIAIPMCLVGAPLMYLLTSIVVYWDNEEA